ncbi:MAG: pyruvate kinase [Nitrospirae bacterium]|nr:pyruvate kinase [Nitrospirota bacterium]
MRRVKIICTIGPSSNSKRVIHELIKAGMDSARLNFSHGTREEHQRVIKTIREGSKRYNSPVSIIQDLAGPKIRVGSIKDGHVMLSKGSVLSLTTKDIEGSSEQLSISYPYLIKDTKVGDRILLDDGLIQLKIIEKRKARLITKIIEGGLLREKKGVNLPGVKISAPAFTEKDKKDAEFGIKMGVDYIAMSFVRSKEDILNLKSWLKRHGADTPVIAKIEKPEAVKNINGILELSDGIMVARGDLGVEIPPEEVPLIQKRLIYEANRSMKPVITATQMLESMTEHLRPTRAEATDVANAVIDGTDALMLSGETAVGKYPVETLKMMDRIINFTETGYSITTESSQPTARHSRFTNFAQAIAESACISAHDIKAKVIVAFTRTGFTALLASKQRPQVPIIAFTTTKDVQRRMNLYWGIKPLIMGFPHSTDEMIYKSEKALLRNGIVKKGDSIVIIATSHFALGEKTNIMKLHRIGC